MAEPEVVYFNDPDKGRNRARISNKNKKKLRVSTNNFKCLNFFEAFICHAYYLLLLRMLCHYSREM